VAKEGEELCRSIMLCAVELGAPCRVGFHYCEKRLNFSGDVKYTAPFFESYQGCGIGNEALWEAFGVTRLFGEMSAMGQVSTLASAYAQLSGKPPFAVASARASAVIESQ
jgi:hypothetical protein